MICTAHQPNFLPWMPYFEKIAQADVFVMLAQCQFEKNGYQNRFRLNDEWHTMSVQKGLDPIIQKQYVNPQDCWQRIKRRLPDYPQLLGDLDTGISHSLFHTNAHIIFHLLGLLCINTEVKPDQPTELNSTERLLEICMQCNCDTYLSGPSGRKYLDITMFEKQGIEVKFFEASDKRHTLEVLG